MRNINPKDVANAGRLRAIWRRKQGELNLTQVKASKILGISQSAFSQYINCTVALNTDMIFAMAAMLKVAPQEIDPTITTKLKLIDTKMTQKLLPVLDTTNARIKKKEHFVLVNLLEREANRAGLYAIEVAEPIPTNTHAGFIPRGTILVLDPNLPLMGGKEVLVYHAGKYHFGRVAMNTDAVLEIRPLHQPEEERLTFEWEDIAFAHRLSSMHLPN